MPGYSGSLGGGSGGCTTATELEMYRESFVYLMESQSSD